jgi:tripartite-type tricarboxylate transporter receptor subunit TctC
MAGVKATHVPFKGGGPAVIALVGGEIQSILTPIAEVFPHINSGRLRPIAVSSATRTTQFPNVPAIAETVKGYDFTSWFGCLAPAGTPKPIIDRLSAEIKKALSNPDVIARLAPQVLDPMHQTPEEFTRHLQEEYDRMREVVRLSGARID